LPEVEFVDIGVQTMRLRMIKSAEEIAVITHGYDHAQDLTRPARRTDFSQSEQRD